MICQASADVVPTQKMPREKLSNPGLPIIDAFFESGLCQTKNEARRIITQGGGYMNDRRIESIDMRLTAADLLHGSMVLLRSGKKKHMRLQFVD